MCFECAGGQAPTYTQLLACQSKIPLAESAEVQVGSTGVTLALRHFFGIEQHKL